MGWRVAILDVLRPGGDVPAPPVVIIDATELVRRTADVIREVQHGAVVRVDDRRSRRTVAWLSIDPPERVRPVLHLLSPAGEVNDHLAADLAGMLAPEAQQ
jgi:hypothetical protein